MSYDHWKTTEPEPSLEWQECSVCGHRDLIDHMWIGDGGWFCDEHAEEVRQRLR